jgi:D-lactate dehydrogenase (cytochrome)
MYPEAETCLIPRSEVSKDDLNKIGLFGSMLGHIGDGNFHETILFDGTKERKVVEKCVHDMVHRALEMEGTCTVGTLYNLFFSC